MSSVRFVLALCLMAHAQCLPRDFVIPPQDPPVQLSLVSPKGLRFKLTGNTDDVEYYHAHFNINKALPGVGSGQFNSLNIKAAESWTYEELGAEVKPGDTVYYWILVHYRGNPPTHQWTDQKWVATSSETTTASTTKGTTTKKPDVTETSTSSDTTATKPMTTSGGNTTDTTTATKPTPPPAPQGCTTYPCLIFEDNFDTLNFSTWEHEITAGGGGNWEFEYYVNNRSNSYAKNGSLHIKPTLTADRFGEVFLSSGTLDIWGNQPADKCTGNLFYGCFRQGTSTNYINPIQSARLRSVRSFNFRYGKIEFRAKMPLGDWIWPALWLLPTRQEYGLWPASGEMDICESRGNRDFKDKNGKQIGVQNVGQTLHWGPFFPVDPFQKTQVSKDAPSGTYGSDYHTFGAEWDEDHFSFTIDGEETLKVDPGDGGFWEYGKFAKFCPKCDNPWNQPGSNKMAPFDKEFYIIMNVAVGGTNGYFPDDGVNAGGHKPWTNKEQVAFKDFWNGRGQWYPTWNPTKNNGEDAAMKVDYVKVWKLKPDN